MSWLKPDWPLYYTRSTGAESRGAVVGPSPRGADLAIEYERDGKTIIHDCASLEKIRFDICSPSPPLPFTITCPNVTFPEVTTCIHESNPRLTEKGFISEL